MTDLRDRIPAQALVEKLVSMRGTPDVRELPLGIVRVSPEALAWLRGIRGEQDAARRLAKLGPEWTVVNSVPVGERDSDIDHLVVGPGGVFAINAKRHIDRTIWVAGGTLLVDGRKTPHIRNSAFEAQRVSAALARADLEVSAVGVIAISGAKSITVKSRAEWKGDAVEVVPMSGLVRLLRRRRLLSAEQVAAVTERVVQPGTWSLRERTPAELESLQREFATIDRGTDRWNLLVRGVALVSLALLAWIGFSIWQTLV